MKRMLTWAVYGMLLVAATGCEKTCDEWYELEDDNCVEMREKFFGYYAGVYTQNGQTINGAIDLSEYSGDVKRLRLSGSNNYFVLTGASSFEVPLQNVYDPQGTQHRRKRFFKRKSDFFQLNSNSKWPDCHSELHWYQIVVLHRL
jgi:hypothetical protein